MARKEINVFNVSFLDLLSGALGAVLILFIIIPKLTGDIKLALKELEEIKELKINVTQIEDMLETLKRSVPAAELAKVEKQFDDLESKIKELSTTIESLDSEIKRLQDKLAECDQQRTKLREKVKELEKQIEDLKNQLDNNGTLVQQLEKQVEQQKQQIANLEGQKAELEVDIQNKQQELETVTEENEDLAQQIKDLQEQLKNANETIEDQKETIKEYESRIGIEVEDQNVVFVVDISGSMDDDPEPQKLDEVRAGIKMMVATMDDTYNIDVVIFPKSKDERYGYKYGSLRKVTQNTKYDVYRYLSSLRAYGCTPTRDVLNFVLTSNQYKDAGTVIFLSDGTPTKRIGETQCDDDDIPDVLNFVKNLNAGKRVINCIGVGADFRNQTPGDPKVEFMKKLASDNGGFYIGF